MSERRGGKRPGAGRPKGSGKGRQYVGRTIQLREDQWAKLDRLAGDKGRNAFLREKVDNMKEKNQ